MSIVSGFLENELASYFSFFTLGTGATSFMSKWRNSFSIS